MADGASGRDPAASGTMRRRPCVVHVSTVHAPGDNRIVYKECQTLAEAGYNVHYVGTNATSIEGLPSVTMHDLPLRGSRLSRMTAGPAGAVRVVRGLHPDLIHLHDPELLPWVPGFKLDGTRVIYDAHEHLPSQVLAKGYLHRRVQRPLAVAAKGLERWADMACDAVVCATPAIVDAHPRGRTVLVQNYPRIEGGYSRASVAFDQRDMAVAYVGGIAEGRGIRHLVDAMAIAGPETGVRLLLAGRFSPPSLQSEVERLDGWAYVDYLGQVPAPEVPDLLGRVRGGVVTLLPLPNYLEAYPTKMFEYMAAGLPVIASDFPLWRSVVDGVDCGLLVNPESSSEIASAIVRLVEDTEGGEAMGARGASEVAKELNWARQADRLLTLYGELTLQ